MNKVIDELSNHIDSLFKINEDILTISETSMNIAEKNNNMILNSLNENIEKNLSLIEEMEIKQFGHILFQRHKDKGGNK